MSNSPFPVEGGATTTVGHGISLIEPDRFVVRGQRLVEFVLVQQGVAAPSVGLGVNRIEPDRFVPGDDGLIEIPSLERI